jgi:DnaJ family protein C protein 2
VSVINHVNKVSYRKEPCTIQPAFLSSLDRKMVLKHHPDKSHSRKSKMHLDAVQEYFTCITKAGEILMNKGKRRAYDSIDPTFDDYVPPVNPNSKINFYQVFGPVFETNSRWVFQRLLYVKTFFDQDF